MHFGLMTCDLTYDRLIMSIVPSPLNDASDYMGKFTRVRLDFKHLNVHVTLKNKNKELSTKTILNNVSGSIKPGEMLAVMGSSGAGKSTLLNVLSMRNIPASGSVSWNGSPLNNEFLQNSAFVQQEDMFLPLLKVREHLKFQVDLRLPNTMSSIAKHELVESLIQRLGLSKCANSFIGNMQAGGPRGISGGERKRLSIASELITNPSVLFLDEPTSGLDSFMAASVVELLKDLAQQGHTIVCTIHQPASTVYALFDRVCFLAEGQIVFMGDRVDAPPHWAEVGYDIPPFTNHADFLVRSLALPSGDSDARNRVDKFHAAWSAKMKTLELEDASESADIVPTAGSASLVYSRNGYVNSWWHQYKTLTRRELVHMSRNPKETIAVAIQTIFTALLTSFVNFQIPDNQRVVQNKSGAIFFVIMNQTMPNCMMILNKLPELRAIAIRESESGAYHMSALFASVMSADFPKQVIFPIVFICISYFIIGFNANAGSFFLTAMFLLLQVFAGCSLSYCISAAVSSVAVATALVPIILVPFQLFSGFSLNFNDIPIGFKWLEYASFFKYGFKGIMSSVFHFDYPDLPPGTCDGQPRCYQTGEEILHSFDINGDKWWENIIALVCIGVIYRCIGGCLIVLTTRRKSQSTN